MVLSLSKIILRAYLMFCTRFAHIGQYKAVSLYTINGANIMLSVRDALSTKMNNDRTKCGQLRTKHCLFRQKICSKSRLQILTLGCHDALIGIYT